MDEGNFSSVIEILKKVEETLSCTQSSLHQEKKKRFISLYRIHVLFSLKFQL